MALRGIFATMDLPDRVFEESNVSSYAVTVDCTLQYVSAKKGRTTLFGMVDI